MVKDTLQAATPTDPAPVETPVEEVVTPTITEEESATDASGEVVPAEKESEDVQPTKAEKRIQQLVAKQREAEREAAYWKGVAEASKHAPAPEQKPEEAPKVDDFENYDDYIVARAKFEMKKETPKAPTVNVEQKLDEQFREKMLLATQEDPMIGDVISDPTLPVNPNMAMLIKASDNPAGLIRYLDANRDEALKIYKMDALTAARHMIKVELKLEGQAKPTTKKVSTAPEPVKPVTPNTGAATSLDDLPIDEFMKRRNKKGSAK